MCNCESSSPTPESTTPYSSKLSLHISGQLPDKQLAATESIPSTLRHPLSQRFHEILQEIGELHDQKQRDYGAAADPFANVRATELYGLPGWWGGPIRMNDKMIRIQKHIREGGLVNDSVEDDLRDVAVYAVIALVMKEEYDSAQEPL